MSFDPGKLMVEVDEGADRLEKAADALTDAIRVFEEAEAAYEMAMAIERTRVYHSADKPPAADVRHDIALQKIDTEIREQYSAAKASKESLQARYRALAASVSARQSLLKALTT